MAIRRESVSQAVGVVIVAALATGVSTQGQMVRAPAPVDPGVGRCIGRRLAARRPNPGRNGHSSTTERAGLPTPK
jgi:hypothetical protein